eukprot:4612403-Pyramimonas_sp.AAC.1
MASAASRGRRLISVAQGRGRSKANCERKTSWQAGSWSFPLSHFGPLAWVMSRVACHCTWTCRGI